jgi:3D (Asp-Asp-Asp) domain-containing protein
VELVTLKYLKMKITTFLLVLLPLTLGNFSFIGEIVEPKSDLNDFNLTQKVTLTIYSPTESETDSTPNLTASGFEIDMNNPGKHKIIAVSRDLKRKGWKFGEKVRIKGAGKYNGVYTIRDLMNKRHKNRVDVLVGGEDKPIKMKNVEVTLLK